MTAPNVVGVATITGKTDVQAAVGTSPTNIVSNASASDDVYKVNMLLVSNILASAVTVTVDLYRSATAYTLCKDISLPVGATLDVLNKAIYLEEGDDLRVTCDTASGLDVVASYEIITD